MRSRYAAFALGLGEYLVRTLASTHPDLALPREELVRSLARARQKQRFVGLRILRATSAGDTGEVLFFAEIFEQGKERSFGERSTFVREANGWRYAEGVLVAKEELAEA
jgi:SEC-C motif-containing protein